MKKTLFALLAVVFLAVAGWQTYEYFWDKELFAKSGSVMEIANVDKEAATILMEDEPKLQIVDVRPARSYRSAHLPGARNVTYKGGHLDPDAVKQLSKTDPVLVYCDGGFRSRLSLQAFRDAGFERIFNLHRGILWWRMSGGPTESGDGS